MYHPGRVVSVLSGKDVVSSDASVQAVTDMWDRNVLTFDVAEKLKDKIKEGDIVLVDYTPLKDMPAPKHVIVKILKGSKGKEIAEKYNEYYKSKNRVKRDSGYVS